MSMMINPSGGNQVVAAGKPFTLRMPKKKPADADAPDDVDQTTAAIDDDTDDTDTDEQPDD